MFLAFPPLPKSNSPFTSRCYAHQGTSTELSVVAHAWNTSTYEADTIELLVVQS